MQWHNLVSMINAISTNAAGCDKQGEQNAINKVSGSGNEWRRGLGHWLLRGFDPTLRIP